jgi:hypothetical protein
MVHAQQLILEGYRNALVAADTAAGPRVFLDRVDPLEVEDLPAILIEEDQQGERSDPQTVNGMQSRVLSVLVTAVVAHSEGYGAQARALGLEIERVLGASTFAAPKPGRTALTSSRIRFSGEGDRLLAAREQAWQTQYFTRRGAPDQPL